jgi:hypothetical protein
LRCVGHEIRHSKVFKRRTLVLDLHVVGGPHDGVRLRWFAPLPTNPRRRPGPFSKALRLWALLEGRRLERGKYLSFKVLHEKPAVRGSVRTVTQSWERHISEDGRRRPVPLPACAHYSIVATILERVL